MEQITNLNPVLLVVNVLLALASIFGGTWLKRMESDMRDLQRSHTEQQERQAKREIELLEKLNDKVAKDDFKDFRVEQRDNFQRLFEGIDDLRERINKKADRI